MTLVRLMDIAQGWMPAFEKAAECERLLQAHGHTAHNTYREFLSQFAASPKDIEIHRRCFVERGKSYATHAPVLDGHRLELRQRYYISPFLQSLQLDLAKRASFDTVEAWKKTGNLAHWQMEPDPLLRAKSMHIVPQGQDVHDHYQSIFRDQARMAFEQEAQRFPPSEIGSLLLDSRLAVFRRLSMQYLGPMGFRLAPSSLKNYAALDLEISPEYVLRWSIGEINPFYMINYPAGLQPTLHLRQKSYKKRINDSDKDTRLLQFPIQLLVEGIPQVYCDCYDARDAQLVIRVFSLIVEWVLPDILGAIRAAGL